MKYSYEKVLENYQLMKKCFQGEKAPSKYIHYTSQESFYAMFKDYIEKTDTNISSYEELKYIVMFASQIQYLNDKQEYREGMQIIKDSSIDTTNLFESIFVTCFCGEEDLLSQWKYYGKNCGIAIEFDFSESTMICWYDEIKNGKRELPAPKYWANIMPYNVLYSNHNEIFYNIRRIINESYKDTSDREAANIFIPYCKNEKFKEEAESRLVFYPIELKTIEGKEINTKIEYRNNGKLTPQFKCKISFSDQEKAKKKIPVKSIMVGPGNNQRLVFNSIIRMLESNKEHIKFYSDDALDNILQKKSTLADNGKIGILNQRITYKTEDGILISMSSVPFRD